MYFKRQRLECAPRGGKLKGEEEIEDRKEGEQSGEKLRDMGENS